MANNIEALARQPRPNIIVDDVGYSDEPMFQDGLISQAIDTVVADGVTYFSAAGNAGRTSGYLSTFRAATGNDPGHRLRHLHEFQPSGCSQHLELPVTTDGPDAELIVRV